MADYIDASALVPLLVVEPDSPWCLARVSSPETDLLVSDFAGAEVGATVSKFVRMGLMSAEDGRALLARFDDWLQSKSRFVETAASDIADAGELVRRFELKLHTPDALHLVLARRHEARLLTRDKGLARAAEMIGLVVLTPA